MARGGLLGARSALYNAITDLPLNEAFPMIVHEFQDKHQPEPVALTAWLQSNDERLVRCQEHLNALLCMYRSPGGHALYVLPNTEA